MKSTDFLFKQSDIGTATRKFSPACNASQSFHRTPANTLGSWLAYMETLFLLALLSLRQCLHCKVNLM